MQRGQVFELKRGEAVRFELVARLPTGAVPFAKAEAEMLGHNVHEAARQIATN